MEEDKQTEQEQGGREIPEDVRRALSYIGSIKTTKKAEASRQNGRLYGGRPQKDLAEIPCNCGGQGLDHKSTCPRGRTIRRRRKKGQPLT